MDGEERSTHSKSYAAEPESYPTAGGSFIVEDGVTRPLTTKEEEAAADARSALTPSDMKQFATEHAAKLAAKAEEPSEPTEAAPRRAARGRSS